MVLPLALAGVAAGASFAGGALNAYAQVEQAKTNQAIARINANNLRAAADQTLVAGEEAVRDTFAQAKAVSAVGDVAAASGNIVVGEGSAALVAEGNNLAAISASNQVRLNASRQARGMRSQADMLEFQAEAARRQANIGAVASLLGGGAGAVRSFI